MTIQCSLGHDNPDGSAFCDECGEPLASTAPVATGAPAPAPVAAAPAPAGSPTCPACGSGNGGEDGGVSRLHARIFYDNGQYLLEDENSTNFTFLNRQKLAGKTPTPLHDNDEIRLGRVLLRFKEA